MVKNEENYGMGQTSKGNLDKQIKKPTSDNLEKLMNVDILEKPLNEVAWGRNKDSKRKLSRIEVNKSIKLNKLYPFLDSDGLLRVGVRLGKSRLSQSEARHLALPKQSKYQKQ